MQRFSSDQLAHDLSAAFRWLDSIGVRSKGTRFAGYAASIDEHARKMDRAWVPGTSATFELSPIIRAIYDCNDLIHIHKYLAPQFHESLLFKLGKFVSGPASYVHESASSSSNVARNYGLELIVSARLAAAGVPLIFDTRADAAGSIDGRIVAFQCKRLQSINKLEKNFKKARYQLRADYDERPDCYGVVVIDVTPVLNPDFGVPIFDHERDVEQWLHGTAYDFMAKYNHVWQSIPDSKTIGVLGRYLGMALLPARPQLMQRGEITPLVPRAQEGTESRKTCDALAKILASVHEKLNAAD